MPITTAFRFALTAAALCAAVPTADARPRRVVVLDFDGPRQLADTGRSLVLAALGNQIDVVAAQRWEQARNTASCCPSAASTKRKQTRWGCSTWRGPDMIRTRRLRFGNA